MLCSAIKHSTHCWTTRSIPGTKAGTPAPGSSYSKPTPSGDAGSASLPGSESSLSSAEAKPHNHLFLNKERETKVFTQFFSELLIYFSFLILHFSTLVLYFTFVSAMLQHFTLLLHLTFYSFSYLSIHIYFYKTQNIPEERERYHT